MIPDEREWQAQEVAMRSERAGLEPPASDTLAAAYLPIAQALNQPLDPVLPADFAARVTALAASGHRSEEADSQLERWLLISLTTIFGICALAAVVIYGSGWLGNSFNLLAQAGGINSGWLMVLAACLAVSWFSEALRKRTADRGPGLA